MMYVSRGTRLPSDYIIVSRVGSTPTSSAILRYINQRVTRTYLCVWQSFGSYLSFSRELRVLRPPPFVFVKIPQK